MAQRAQVAKSDSDLDTQMLLQHPEYYRIFGSVYAHMWFFKNIISEVTSLEQVLCAGNFDCIAVIAVLLWYMYKILVTFA